MPEQGGIGAQEEINLAMSNSLRLEILSFKKHQLLSGQATSLIMFATPHTLSFLVERKVICCVAVSLPDCVQVLRPLAVFDGLESYTHKSFVIF